MTIRSALNSTLFDLMDKDPDIIVLGEDIAGGDDPDGGVTLGGCFGVTDGLYQKFGAARVMNMPISETAFMGAAVGAAMTGLKPIVEIMFCDFMGVCFDQIINQAAKARFLSGDKRKMPLVIRTTMGAGDGSGAMHSQSLYGMLMQVAGLNVAVPATPSEAANVLRKAISSDDPTVIFEHKSLYDQDDIHWLADGGDATVVAVGATAHKARRAQEDLATHDINIDVVNPVWLAPLDLAPILDSVSKTGRLIVVDEGTHQAGFADAIVSAVSMRAFDVLKTAPIILAPPATPVPYGSALENDWLPSEADIIEAVKGLHNEN